MIRAFILARAASDREGLRSRLASPDLAVVGASASLDDMRSSRPDVVVLADESLAGPRGSTLPPVVVWSDDPNAAARVRGSASGAWGLVGRQASAVQLQAAVRAVASGLCVMRADVIPALLQGDARPLEQDARRRGRICGSRTADTARAGCARPGEPRSLEPGDRRRARDQRAHRQVSPGRHLRKAGRVDAHGGCPARAASGESSPFDSTKGPILAVHVPSELS